MVASIRALRASATNPSELPFLRRTRPGAGEVRDAAPAPRDGQAVSQASAAFGFSRPSFYEAQAAFSESGLPGLVPQRPGPKRAHKLSGPVLDVLEAALADQPSLNSAALAAIVADRFGLRVHPRSVERALQRRGKGGPPQVS